VKQKKKTENGILRLVFAGVALVFQIVWILLRVRLLNAYSDKIATITASLIFIFPLLRLVQCDTIFFSFSKPP
jgi:hypothetical protein